MKKFLKELLRDIEFSTGMYVTCEGKSEFMARLLAWRDALGWGIGAAVCYFRGHKMVDDSHAGPDSGDMAGHCERCGYSFRTILY